MAKRPYVMDDEPVKVKKIKIKPLKEKREKKEKLDREKRLKKNELMVIEEPKPKKKRLKYKDLSQNKKLQEVLPTSKLGSFAKASNQIQQLLENKENDSAILLAQRRMLQTTIDLIPIAERKYRETANERAAYALNTLMDRASILISDIIASEDRAQLTERIMTQVIEPSIKSHAQIAFMSMINAKTSLATEMPKNAKKINQIMERSIREIAEHLQASFREMENKIKDMM